jgi:hypothetical protein
VFHHDVGDLGLGGDREQQDHGRVQPSAFPPGRKRRRGRVEKMRRMQLSAWVSASVSVSVSVSVSGSASASVSVALRGGWGFLCADWCRCAEQQSPERNRARSIPSIPIHSLLLPPRIGADSRSLDRRTFRQEERSWVRHENEQAVRTPIPWAVGGCPAVRLQTSSPGLRETTRLRRAGLRTKSSDRAHPRALGWALHEGSRRRHRNVVMPTVHGMGPHERARHARRSDCAPRGACGRRSNPGETLRVPPRAQKRSESLGKPGVVGARSAWPKRNYGQACARVKEALMCAGVTHPTGLHPPSFPQARI